MERHGYGPKTFRLETDGQGNPGIHFVKAKHQVAHYMTDTYNRVKSELPFQFTRDPNAQDNLHVIIMGGLKRLDNGNVGYAWYHARGKAGGVAVLVGEALHFRLIAHEIGHTFGLQHTDIEGALMGAWEDILLENEAHWLDQHHMFNDTHIRNNLPQFIEILPLEAIGKETVRFKVVATSKSGLYHAQIYRERGSFAIGHTKLEGEKTTIEIDVPRSRILDGDYASIQIMDIHGNNMLKNLGTIILPEPIIVDINADGVVNIQDLVRVASQFGEMWDGKEDVNSDGIVNILDLVLVANAF